MSRQTLNRIEEQYMSERRIGSQEAAQGAIDLESIGFGVMKTFKRFFWLLLVGAIVTATAMCVYTGMTYTPLYTVSATFTVDVMSGLGVSSSYYNNATAQQLARTFPYILESGVLSNMVAEELGIEELPPISASVVEDTPLFTISVTSDSAQIAYDVIVMTIEKYPSIAENVIGATTLTLLEMPYIPTSPSNTLSYRDMAIRGAVYGAMGGLVVLVLISIARPTVRNIDDMKRMINLRALGAIPAVMERRRSENRSDRANSRLLLMNNNAPQNYADAMRIVRARVDKLSREKGYKRILITSAIPGEGKTTVTINIATSLAQRGYKVIIIDCDLRNPSVGRRILGSTSQDDAVVDISDYIKGEAQLDDIIEEVAPNLQVVRGGKPIYFASETLSSGAMRELIGELGERADYVIMDTPPCSMMADATVLASYADAAIFVVREDYARRSQVIEGIEHLSNSGVSFLGFVINGAGSTSFSVFDTDGKRYSKYGRRYGSYGGYGGYGRYGAYEKAQKER
ncbi:MAG: polysaccharide biosynthesis tyrosine autokinase [Clostridia bacterium]|nr:polysaccharide biosynthesis tyrosine autokinase [Clostridia bacterium]